MARLLHLPLFAIVLVAAGVHPVKACSTACRVSDEPEPAFGEAHAVFTGRVVARQETRTVDAFGEAVVEIVARLAVETRWKGASTSVVVVRSGFSTLCGGGVPFLLDQEYLVWAYRSAEETGVLDAGFCTRTALLENAADDLEFLGSPDTTDGCHVGDPSAAAWNVIVLLFGPAIAMLRRAIAVGPTTRGSRRGPAAGAAERRRWAAS